MSLLDLTLAFALVLKLAILALILLPFASMPRISRDADEGTSCTPFRLKQMKEYYQRRRVNLRDAKKKAKLQARIDRCQDPILRAMLECYMNGESVEKIAAAAKMGEEQVRKFLRA